MALSHIGESSISLADLRSRRVPVEWFEAIAVIQELSRVLVESGGDPAHASLAPQDISIDASGIVRVVTSKARDGESVVRRVGELLQMSIADSAFPVPLRLVITQAVATPPFYASLGELANALEYFERPDRTGLIRAVYARALTHQPTSDVVEQPVQPAQQKNAAPPRTRRARRFSTRAIVVSVAALAAIAIGVAASQVATWPTWPQGSVTAVEQQTGNVSDPASPDAPLPKRSDDSSGATASVLASAPRGIDFVGPRDIAPDLSWTGEPATMDTAEPIAFEPVATSEATVADAADATIYSRGDDDVTPPVATYPRLALPPADVRSEDHSTIELLVGETGLVESVRLVGRPHNLGEAMLVTLNLSAAKTWRFRPAVRDGHPVRYRTLVQLWPTTR